MKRSRAQLRLSGHSDKIVTELSEWALQYLDGDLASWFEIRCSQGNWVINDGRVLADSHIREVWFADTGLAAATRDLRPDLPDPRQQNRVVNLPSLVEGLSGVAAETHRRLYTSFGFNDQRRALVYDGRRFLGWIGVVKHEDSKPFTRMDTAAFGRMIPSIRGALRAHSAGPQLDGRGANACVLKESGALEFATEGARRWLTRDRRKRLGEAIRRAASPISTTVVYVDRTEATITPLNGHGPQCYLLTLAATEPALLNPVYDLSVRQREVAGLASAGASASEVARMLKLSPHTIRDHLKVVYRVLGVSSRAELGQLWGRLEDSGALSNTGFSSGPEPPPIGG